jgi:nucleotide-binding universal stress UspA family protein
VTKVLIAYDGSVHSQRALRWSDRLRAEDQVAVISVAQSLIEGPRTSEYTDPSSSPSEHERLLDEAQGFLREQGIDAERVNLIGNPAHEILEFAERTGVELIVVGRSGRGAVRRFLLGSVAGRVVEHAPCDVLVVR